MQKKTLEQRIPHRTVPRYNQEVVETEGKSIARTHIYMTMHLSGLVEALQ